MPGGKGPKGRGTAYEYRVRNWFRDRDGWESERNDLSGASQQISTLIGKHDVRASSYGIFLQIECKKTKARGEHKLQREWYDKINFANDELLVFAFGRSPHYVTVPEDVYKSLNSQYVSTTPRYVATGKSIFTFHRKWLDEEEIVVYLWKPFGEVFIAAPLEHLIELIEKRGPLMALNPMDFINSSTEIGELTTWHKEHRHRLTNKEKCHYYGKLHRLEHGIDDKVSPEFKASVQWWRDTSEDVVMKCPHCNELITYDQFKNRDDNSDQSID